MRKVILQMYTSIDGYVAGPNGELDWMFANVGTESGSPAAELLDSSDLILLGRGMAKGFLDYWPNDTSEFAEKINALPKIVFSKTLTSMEYPDVTVSANIEEEIKKQKAKDGKNLILYGGCGLVTSFAKAGLIDEYYLMTVPVILGNGLHLFKGIDMKVLKLVKSKASPSGVIVNHYEKK
ncbi:MAG: dihydrofolate reductase family protein [Bacteroidetes bacterium]|nr:dihydrofolate reductase family protein [Bacteroidota bacterium]